MSEEGKGKPKILIVDDDLKQGKNISDILEAKDYTPLVVLTGKEGVAAVKEEDISLALIDLKLPDMSGIEVLKEIKKNSPRTEAIILMGYASLDTAMEAVSLGAFSYLQKPCDMERLILDIRRALERRWAEEELIKEKAKITEMIEKMPAAVTIMGIDGTIRQVNSEFERGSGWKREETVGNTPLQLGIMSMEEGQKIEKEVLPKLMKEGVVRDIETVAIRRDGTKFPALISWILMKDPEGKPTGIITVAIDISERKRAEEEVEKSRKFLDTIIENIPDPLYIKDSQFRFVEVNKAFCRTRKVTRGEILGETRYRETDEEVFKTGKELEIPEQHYTDTEGNQHWTYLKKVPLTDESGEITHVLTISRDITKRKAMENTLRVAYKELKTLDKLKTDFLNVTYHDLRSPLAPIIGYASLLEQSKLSEKQKNYVRIIEKSARQLEEMIARMLEVTRIETGKVELTLEHVSIAEIVKDVLERIKPQIDAKKQKISTVVPEGIEVEGDKQKIAAIFDNLILNAIKYTDEKGRIDIVAEDRKDEGNIRVCVEDTGAGISEENLPRIFERFYMVDTSLTRKGGLGLGLAIVKGYVKLHGGKVMVTSELGKGSKFCFTLPKRQK